MTPTLINLFLPDGEPAGIRVISISGRTLSGIVVPRILFQEFKKREEYDRTGVYILVGANEETADTRIYVGEADPVGPRLESHVRNKGFWTHAIAFTAQGSGLHKAHVEYLESRLYTLASQAKRCVLDNGNAPALPTLNEMQKAEAEGYLNEMLMHLTKAVSFWIIHAWDDPNFRRRCRNSGSNSRPTPSVWSISHRADGRMALCARSVVEAGVG